VLPIGGKQAYSTRIQPKAYSIQLPTRIQLDAAASHAAHIHIHQLFPSPLPRLDQFFPSHPSKIMDADPQNSLADPFLSHLVLVLSIYELGPFPAPVPRYDGPSSWQTDNILRALKTMARRMYTAEETLASIKASENWENGPDTKKRRSVGDTPPISNPSANSSQSDVLSNSSIHPISSNGSTALASGYSSSTIRSTPIPHSSPSFFPPYNLAALPISNGHQYVREQL
jgi:hypothetical protein